MDMFSSGVLRQILPLKCLEKAKILQMGSQDRIERAATFGRGTQSRRTIWKVVVGFAIQYILHL